MGLNLQPCHHSWWQSPDSWKIAYMAQNNQNIHNNLIWSNITSWAFGVGGLLAYTENLIINVIIIFYFYTLLISMISIYFVYKWNNLIIFLLCFTSIQHAEAKISFLKLDFSPWLAGWFCNFELTWNIEKKKQERRPLK